MQPHHFSSQIHDADNSAYIKHQKVIQEQAKKIAELEKKLEDVQNTMATENVDLGMENHNLKQRIKELENDLYTPCGVTTKLLNRINNFVTEDKSAQNLIEDCYKCIQSLLSQQPKWISVDDGLPNQKDFDEDLQDAHGVYLWITDGQTTYYGSYTFKNKSFYKNDDLKKPIKTTHWMYGRNWIPKPPTTEKSSSVEEG